MNALFKTFSDESQQVMKLAEKEARGLDHQYVGTEHILLALARQPGICADVMRLFDVDADRIQAEIEAMVLRGPVQGAAAPLPLTRRARFVLDHASQEARMLGQPLVSPEHLLMGLICEPDGVAGQVMRKLGLKPGELGAEAFKVRIAQMKTVESVVRPLRASTWHKRKIREELLAHLSEVYEQELDRLRDSTVALSESTRRFGNLAQVSSQLQRALPWYDRMEYWLERRLGWRAPETVSRWMLRVSMQILFISAIMCGVGAAFVVADLGWHISAWIAIRPIVVLTLLAPADQFVLGLLYYKIRDSLFGVFGSRPSTTRVIALAALHALVLLVSVTAFEAACQVDLREVSVALGFASVIAAAATVLAARSNGPTEISDAMWACLDVEPS